MTFSGIIATAAAALIAWASTHSAGDAGLWVIWLMIAGLLFAAATALKSAAPTSFESPGNTPAAWIEDIAEGVDDLHSARAAMAAYYAEMIDLNADTMTENALMLGLALRSTFLTLLLGGALAGAGLFHG